MKALHLSARRGGDTEEEGGGKGNEGRLDVCCLRTARASQLGRVNGRSADWLMIHSSAIRGEGSRLRRVGRPWNDFCFSASSERRTRVARVQRESKTRAPP